MCGIAGATRNLLGNDPQSILKRMNEVMKHRGPDMGEVLFDTEMGLCHRRLSIIDLSEDGRQPMVSEDGRYWIVFNGEIYNFQELRQELSQKGHVFHSRTDTEVLLILYAEYGPASLEKIRGMYAYAIWDNVKRELFAARDRIGKKPFYFYHQQNKFAFASELKSILEIDAIPQLVDDTAVYDFLKFLYIPHPKSIYKHIHKLEPGHFLLFRNGCLTIRKYWDIDFSSPLKGSQEDLCRELVSIIQDAVQCRMVADVPLGAFLSGGIDSSGIVALMSQVSADPLITCTIGFNNKRHNEAEYARKFAQRLSTRHYEQYINDEPTVIVKKLIWHFDEPFADSSMVPTYYVSKIARQYVTVALSGDGGDESFAGYSKYVIDRLENRVRKFVPAFLLRSVVTLLKSFSGITPLRRTCSLARSALLDPATAFAVTNSFLPDAQECKLFSERFRQEIRGYSPFDHIRRYYDCANGPDHLSKILYTDLKLFLPGDILVKVDRMTMANSLEVRSPLLDQKVIEFAAQLPSALKLRKSEKKFLLKKAFRPLLGDEIINRKKHGFTVPLNQWFRNELREMADQVLLQSPRLENWFSVPSVRRIWDEHQHGTRNHGTLLWTLFTFALWLEQVE